MPEDELVKANLQMTTACSMMRSRKPLPAITESAIGQRNNGRCALT
jgi:hypothetical protein